MHFGERSCGWRGRHRLNASWCLHTFGVRLQLVEAVDVDGPPVESRQVAGTADDVGFAIRPSASATHSALDQLRTAQLFHLGDRRIQHQLQLRLRTSFCSIAKTRLIGRVSAYQQFTTKYNC